jgi:hypothetical protein
MDKGTANFLITPFNKQSTKNFKGEAIIAVQDN